MKKGKIFAITCSLAAVIMAGSALPVMAADASGAAAETPSVSQQASETEKTPSSGTTDGTQKTRNAKKAKPPT